MRTSKTEGSMSVLQYGGDYGGRTGKREEGGEEREGWDGRG